MKHQLSWRVLGAIVTVIFAASACSDPSEDSSGTPDTSGTSNSTSNGTTGGATSNGTTSETSNGTSNNTTGTSNGTTGNTSNGTTGNTSNGTTGTTTSGLQVADSSARACEVMITDAENSLKEVRFADTVEGRSMRRGDNLAVSFFVKEDTAIPSGAVSFETEGPTDAIVIANSRCFDRPGAVIAAPEVSLKF